MNGIIRSAFVANWQHFFKRLQANALKRKPRADLQNSITRMTTNPFKPQPAGTSLIINVSASDCRSPNPNNVSSSPLNPEEQRQLKNCEDILCRGLGTFFEVGQALLTIREARLYREEFSTFEAYCHHRWGMGRTYAWRLMGAAERVKLLPSDGKTPRPTNEFQVRPFLKLLPEEFPRAWELVISRARGEKITPSLVRGFVAQMSPQNHAAKSDRKKRKHVRLPKGCSVGGLLVLLRALIEIIISSPRLQFVVPFAVELIGTELQFKHLRPGDFHAGLVRA